MNKKLKVFLPLFLLLSGALNAQPYGCCPNPCEPVSPFCGGYVGANFNFGSVNFLSRRNWFTEVDSSNGLIPPTFRLTQARRQDCGLREAINAVGGGLTLGWAWANPCWYLAAEFNGFFYGNPCSKLCRDNCNDNCNTDCCDGNVVNNNTNNNNANTWNANCNDDCDNCCNRYLSTEDTRWSVNGAAFNNAPRFTYGHCYRNNVRLDGVVKVGFLANQCAVLYLLGGGSGLLLKYAQFKTERDVNNTDDRTYENNAGNTFCCQKWIGGGTIGFGSRFTWCECLDLTVEARYARYQNWCQTQNRPNTVTNTFPEGSVVTPGQFSDRDSVTFRTDSYLGLVGINWRF